VIRKSLSELREEIRGVARAGRRSGKAAIPGQRGLRLGPADGRAVKLPPTLRPTHRRSNAARNGLRS
jgi:hypothetical protein